MTDNVFIQPLKLSDFNPSAPGDSPSFTQLVQDVLGDSASPMDGFDAAIRDTSTAVDLLDQALGEQDAALDAILITLDTTNPAPLDQSMQGYAGTIGDSASILADVQGLTPPPLLVMPITLESSRGIQAPPAQVSIDLGTLKVGAPAIRYLLGSYYNNRLGWHGMFSANLMYGDSGIFRLDSPYTRDRQFFVSGSYVLVVTPAIAGTWEAQVVTVGGTTTGSQIVTFSLIVTP